MSESVFSWLIIKSYLLSIQVKFNCNAKFSCLFNILSVGEIYHCGYTCSKYGVAGSFHVELACFHRYQKMGACRGDFKMLWKPT